MKKANIIVLSGQSNAVGVGHVEYLPDHFDAARIQKWYDGYDNILINYFSHDKKRTEILYRKMRFRRYVAL